ncbi:MAG TPA: PSD1 and planctomycete cytochrome C domain-containing protein [Gemmataceae bacterium]|jgi:hypothetical protein
MKARLAPSLTLIILLAAAVSVHGAGPEFDKAIAPLLIARCLDCHSGGKPKGGLDLSRRRAALAGGDEGEVIVPGKPDESRLWEYVREDKMPPKKPLTAAEKGLLRSWIASGAAWGTDPIDPFRATSSKRAGYDWWALQPVVKRKPPIVEDSRWVRNPIDAFILSKLEANKLHPSATADRRTLIRRLSFDLLGLPPAPEEVADFEKDASPAAYEKLVDRYLQSPQFGVRWARHWLDVVRFGESNGFEFDEPRPNAWPYRDWVVNALNRDVPYDEFVRLQLAGDVLHPDDAEAVTATGFLVAGAYDTVGQTQQSAAMKRVVRQDELEDILGVVGQTFLGLTINCARCHDHKFDPIRQVEYYRLTAALGGVRHGERPLPARPSTKVHAVAPRQPEIAHLLRRGNPDQPAEVVAAGGIPALAGPQADFDLPADAPEGERRKRLAAWITHPKNPLFARTIVNRLWHHHFGVGLVDTPNDFGFNGGRPSHPELLDFLAAELAENGWRLKHIHRLIVTSAAYRQASAWNESAARVDAGNRLLWRKSPRRLEAETVRDAALQVAGRLNLRMGGPGFQDVRMVKAAGTAAVLYLPVDLAGEELRRRTLYRVWSRGGRNRLLDAFDCPDPSTTAPNRAVTTTPLQALAMLNNAFVLHNARHFSARIERESGRDVEAQVRRAYLLAYGRAPKDDEAKLACQVVRRHGLAVLARAILNSNEFLYVD